MFDRLKKLLNPSAAAPKSTALDRLEAAVSPIRELHLRHMQASLAEARQDPSRGTAVELMVELPQPSSFFPRNYFRFDYVIHGPVEPGVGARVIEVQGPLCQPGLTSFELPGLHMTLQPFHWGGCQFLLSGEAKPELESHLVAWFEHWIDIDDERAVAGSDFQGVLHSVSMSGWENGSCSLEIDFGSAPAQAFLELVQLLAHHFEGQLLVDDKVGDESQDPVN